MTVYVYHWSLRPQPDIHIDLEIEAPSALDARREVLAFLERHAAGSWRIEAVSRTSVLPSASRAAPAPMPARSHS